MAGNYYLLGQTCLQLHQYEKAKENFEKGDRDPSRLHARLLRTFGNVRAAGRETKGPAVPGRVSEAEGERLRKGKEPRQSADDAGKWKVFVLRVYRAAAENYQRHGDLGEAEKLWRKSLALSPKNPACRQALASLCRTQGRNAEALEILSRAPPTEGK